MKKLIFVLTVSWSTLSLVAVTPKVTNVSYVQNPNSRVVTVSYDIDRDAIITLDVLTNGVSIGQENIRHVTGCANRVVKASEVRELQWNPVKDWEGRDITDNSVQMRVVAWDVTQPPDYMVVDLAVSNTVNYYTCEEQLPGGIGDARYRRTKLAMRRIPAAGTTFTIGSPVGEPGKDGNVARELLREVQFTNDYYMAVFELTRGQYYKITGNYKVGTWNTDSDFLPAVEGVRWGDLRGNDYLWPESGFSVAPGSLVGKLRGFSGITTFDMPTEARWEFACRAGTTTGLYTGMEFSEANLANIAWSRFSGVTSEQPVGGKTPNGWGLYDMLGNVYERCLDLAEVSIPTPSAPLVDPFGAKAGAPTVAAGMGPLRGGCWKEGESRCAARGFYTRTNDDNEHRWGVRLMCQAW